MPATWTTEEQLAFLKEELVGFRAAQRQQHSPQFLKSLAERWFERWPEREALFFNTADAPAMALTLDDDKKVSEAVKTRIKKLRTWMHWNAGKEKRASTKPDITWLKDAMGKSKGRALQAIELYQQRYKDKIERRVKANFDLEGATTNKERMAVRRRVVSEMWKAEDEDIVAEITEGVEIEKEKKKSKKNEDKGEEETLNDVEARSPEEYNASIQSLPLILQTAFQAITEATGWVFFVSAGGPNPSDDGHIYMENFYFGPLTLVGNDFEASHVGFQDRFQEPFVAHVRNCFPKHVRQSRALKQSLKCVDDEEGGTVIKKLGSGTDSAEISSAVASNGVRLVEGDQERQSSQPKGGMQEELQTVGIDNRGNDSGVDYQQSFPYGLGSPLSFPRISPFQQDGLMTPPPRSVSPFQEGLLLPPGDPQSEPQPYFGDPDSNRPPFAPGGPSSPIENALARLSAAAIHISPAVATASDENIDPALLERGNRPPSPPIVPNYQIPGAAVDQALATTPNECQQETGVGRKRSAEPRKAGRITKAPGPKNSGTQKLARASKKSVERRATMTENEPAQPSARTRKRKLNPDGEEFVKPKKGRRN